MSEWAFVAPSDCGLGCFARTALRAGQVVGEYGGPRLHDRRVGDTQQAAGSFLLQIPQSSVVIDGDYENSPFGAVDGRCVVVFSNHDGRPNARLCTWSTDAELKGLGVDETQHEVRERMWLVTPEPVEAGQELRFNYSAGSLDYWKTVNPNPND